MLRVEVGLVVKLIVNQKLVYFKYLFFFKFEKQCVYGLNINIKKNYIRVRL